MLQLDFWAMGCQMRAVTEGEGGAVRRALEEVPAWFEGWEERLSRFRPESELSQLNLRAGQWVAVSDLLFDQVRLALAMARATGGLVDATVLPALTAAGYDRSFAALAGTMEEAAVGPPLPAGWWGAVELDSEGRRIRLPAGAGLDLGGVSKGWAAATAAQRLAAHGPALVDAGGDIAVEGPRQGGASWPIDVADPRGDEEAVLGTLWIEGGFVATSGRDRRHWQTAQGRQHHLIDPRSGAPAVTDLLSVTVVAPSAELGEAAAKAAFLQGSDEGRKWLERQAKLEGILVTALGRVMTTNGLAAYDWRRHGPAA